MKISKKRFYEILVSETANVLTEQEEAEEETPPERTFADRAAAAGARRPFDLSDLEPAKKLNVFRRMSDRLARWANKEIAPEGTSEEDLEKAFLMMFRRMTEKEAENAITSMTASDEPRSLASAIEAAKEDAGMEEEIPIDAEDAEDIEEPEVTEPEPEEEKEQAPSLKKLKPSDARGALNFFAQTAQLSPEKFSELVGGSVEKILNNLRTQPGIARRFQEEDVPNINLVKDEIVKILSGDFSNLMSESKRGYMYVQPMTHAIIIELAEAA